MDVSVIILTRNTCHQTLHAIESVLSSADTFTKEIHVIDNGSTDGTSGVLRAAFREIHYKKMEQNVGFARGVNLAAGAATGTFLLLLNSDARLAPDALRLAVEWMRADPGCGVAGPGSGTGCGTGGVHARPTTRPSCVISPLT